VGEEGRPLFSQPNWDVRGDVYNVAGNLILSKNGSKDDFARAVRELKAELANLDGLPDDDRRELEEELDQTAADAQTQEPSRDRIVERLSSVRRRLESLQGAASGAVALAKTVGQIAAWAHGFSF
jgi:hypothetical protein